MNLSIRWLTCVLFILPVGVLATGLPGGDAREDTTVSARESLYQAVEAAKKGETARLHAITHRLERKDSNYLSTELLPDYLALLKDEDAQVQMLAVQALGLLNDAASKDALCEYLQNKDMQAFKGRFDRYRQGSLSSETETRQLSWEYQAISWAILALGRIGDESVVPLLASLQDTVDWQIEWVGRPVEKALGDLGAVKALVALPANADSGRISATSGAITAIRNPNAVGDLMAIVEDDRILNDFRLAAVSALGAIGTHNVPDFLVRTLDDPNNSQDLRRTAALAAGETGNEVVEGPLLRYARDRGSNLRPHAFMGLVLYRPETYLDRWFATIADPNEDRAFRERLSGFTSSLPLQPLGGHRDALYTCLHAADRDGRPVDKIRLDMWCVISNVLREEPTVVLTATSTRMRERMRHPIETGMRQDNPRLAPHELRTKVDEAIDRLITVYREHTDQPQGSLRQAPR
ncbi:MAG: HEAT repeat domain-containing protein [Sedimentisphaerales bacterium]|nr:HEAT repeat domain-containing protein [Sedimentisphaerales bacterium]